MARIPGAPRFLAPLGFVGVGGAPVVVSSMCEMRAEIPRTLPPVAWVTEHAGNVAPLLVCTSLFVRMAGPQVLQ